MIWVFTRVTIDISVVTAIDSMATFIQGFIEAELSDFNENKIIMLILIFALPVT